LPDYCFENGIDAAIKPCAAREGMLTDMFKFISNYPISRRLFVAFALAAVLPSVIIAIMGIYNVNLINSRGDATRTISKAQVSTNDLSDSFQKIYMQTKMLESQVLSSLETHNRVTDIDTSINEINLNLNQLQSKLANYQNQFDPATSASMQPVQTALNEVKPNDKTASSESQLLHTIASDVWPQYSNAEKAELELLSNVANSNATPSQGARDISDDAATLDNTYTTFNSNWQQVASDVNTLGKLVNEVNTTQSIVFSTIAAFFLSLIIVIFSGSAVQRSITGPLTELVSLTKRISKGETTARAKVTSRDEIAIVATSMNNMLDNIVHLIQDTQGQHDVLQGQVEKLVSEVSGVGEGDLRVQAEVTADALGVLADSFNYMVEELGSLVVRVKMVAREVGESTSLTSDRMNELVEVADRQIQQIAAAAIEVEHMAQTSQQVANHAQILASNAREARSNAQGGRQAVELTVEGIGRIRTNVLETSGKVQTLGERSREINNIVEAISNIAHQTNRLALDAAIQAAMAGEDGKGFGAVAADIRRLAERAKEQASSVGRIVRSVRDDISAVAVSMRDTERETSAGVKLAEQAGTLLESIFSVIERQGREIDVINQMVTQQQQSSTDVVQIMQVVSESTQESSNSTHEAAQNMERVARLAEQLLASVEAFKLRESLNYFAPGTNSPVMPGNPHERRFISGKLHAVNPTIQTTRNAGLNPGNYTAALPTGPDESIPQYSPALYRQNNPQPFFSNQPDYPNAPFPPHQPDYPNAPFPPQANNSAGDPQQQWPPASPNGWQSGNQSGW
jgi:methyl-accepting chemotaxis protein